MNQFRTCKLTGRQISADHQSLAYVLVNSTKHPLRKFVSKVKLFGFVAIRQ